MVQLVLSEINYFSHSHKVVSETHLRKQMAFVILPVGYVAKTFKRNHFN
jgi:hypothetical protein